MEAILLTISNTLFKYVICNDMNVYGKIDTSSYSGKKTTEAWKIAPHYPLLKLGMNYFFNCLKPALHDLDKNVCFLDIETDKNIEGFLLSCDWCSICNGIIETAKQNILKNPELLKCIDFEKLKVADNYLDFCLVARTEKITNEKTEKWCESIFGKTNCDLLLFSQIYLKLEMIELRWCPFKRSTEFYYRNKDKRYLDPIEQIRWRVGEILSNYETITCNNCPSAVNEKWKYTKSNTKSIFQPLLDFMIKEINSQ